MGGLFSRPTLEEQLRECKRTINRGIRELDRERTQLQNQEKKMINDMKTAARNSQLTSVRTMAKDLVRTRRHIQKFYEMKSHLQGVGMRMQSIKSTEAMARSLASSAQVMSSLNARLNLPALSNILKDFARIFACGAFACRI